MGEAIQDLRKQLAEAEANWHLIQERKSQFVQEVNIPLELVRDERHWEDQIAEMNARLATLQDGPRPYRGLEPFEVEHAAFYFGRQQMVEELVVQVNRANLVFLVGPSGSGKSSLVRAGLAATLGTHPDSRGHTWRIHIFRPGNDPLMAFASQFVSLLEPALSKVDHVIESRKLADHLRDGGEQSVQDLLAQLQRVDRSRAHLLFVIDQFEESYTECQDERAKTLLYSAIVKCAETGWLSVLLILRADFYDQILESPLGGWVSDGLVNTLPMDESERRAAVELPALKAGRTFEAGLVDRILDDASGGPGNLPLLEFALTELWSRQTSAGLLTHAAYEAIGRTSGAIARYAEGVLEQIRHQGHEESARQILTSLVHVARTEGGAKDIPQQAKLEEMEAYPGAVLQTLADARLIVIGRDEIGEDTVRLAHEALIRNCPTLEAWLNADREFLLWRQRLHLRLDEWSAKKGDEEGLLRGSALAEAQRWLGDRSSDLNEAERRFIRISSDALTAEEAAKEQARTEKMRLQRRLIFITTIASLALLVLAITAFLQRNQVLREANVALSRRLAAQASQTTGRDGELALLLAVESVRRAIDDPSSHTWEAVGSLHESLAIAPIAVIPQVWTSTFSLDGRQLATAEKGVIVLRDADTGNAIAQINYTDEVKKMSFSPDATMFAALGGDGTLSLWSILNGTPQPANAPGGKTQDFAFSSSGRQLAIVGKDGAVGLWDTKSASYLRTLELDGPATLAVFSPDGKNLAVASVDGIAISEVESGAILRKLPYSGGTRRMIFSGDGRWLAAIERGNSQGIVGGDVAAVWDIATGAEVYTLKEPSNILELALSPNNRWLALGAWNGLRLFELGGESSSWLTKGPITGVAFDKSGRYALSTSLDGKVRIFDLSNTRLVTSLGYGGEISTAAFSSDGARAIVGDFLGKAGYLWAMPIDQSVASELGLAGNWIYRLSPDGKFLAVIDWNGIFHLVDVDHKSILVSFDNRGSFVDFNANSKYVAVMNKAGYLSLLNTNTGIEQVRFTAVNRWPLILFSADGQHAAVSQGSSVALWNDAMPAQLQAVPTNQDSIRTFAFSDDGKTLAMGYEGGDVTLWDAEKQTIRTSYTLSDSVKQLIFSPDGRYVAAWNDKGAGSEVWVNTVSNGSSAWSALYPNYIVYGMAFNRDGKRLALRGVNSLAFHGSVRLLDTSRWAEITDMRHRMVDPFFDIEAAFSPDGRWLATGGDDGIVNLINAESGQQIAAFHQEAMILQVGFLDEGRRLFSVAVGGDIQSWTTNPEDLLTQACHRLDRNLTQEEWQQYLPGQPYRKTCPNLP